MHSPSYLNEDDDAYFEDVAALYLFNARKTSFYISTNNSSD